MAFPNNARAQYLKTQVETATKEQLVVMLFDGIIRFTEQARRAIETKQVEDSHNALMRAQAIVMELICTVDKDKGGEVASNLLALHAYAFNCLIKCNMHKDVSKIDEVQKIYRELREGWVGAMETLGIAATGTGSVPAGGPPKKGPAPTNPNAPKTVINQPRTIGGAPKPSKPLPSGGSVAMPKPAAPAPQSTPTPGKPTTNPGGTLAQAKPAAAAAAPAPAPTPAPAPAAPAKPAIPATGYGMGRSAMMNGFAKPAPVPPATRPAPAPATPAPIPAPAAGVRPAAIPVPAPAPAAAAPAAGAPAPAPAPKPVVTPMNAKQAAMLNAYQAKSRSIA